MSATSALTKKQFQTLLTLFPQSPIDPVSLPETLGKGKILTYTSRVTVVEINEIIRTFTEENPEKAKDVERWKNQLQYDEYGEKVVLPEPEGGSKYVKRWEPQCFAHNRKPGQPHIKNLSNRFNRIGYKPSLRKIVIGSNMHCLDGQHGLLALWHCLNNDELEHADVSIEINNYDDPVELFRLFDQAQRKRTLKDVLTSINGIPEGFEASLAGTIRFLVLLSSGNGLDSSRMNLPHIKNEKNKPVTILPDELASLMEDGECFDYVLGLVPKILEQTVLVTEEDGSADNVILLSHPMVTGPGRPNAQYYLTAFFNWYLDPRNKLDEKEAINKFAKFLEEVSKGGDSNCQPARKVSDYTPKRAIDWFPRIESCLGAFADGVKEFKPPRSSQFNGIKESYLLWAEENGETEEEETES